MSMVNTALGSTLVIQSHRDPLPLPWLQACLQSVRDWAASAGYDYRFLGDELFAPVPEELLAKCAGRTPIAADLGRLYAVRSALVEGYDTVVWLDADMLVLDDSRFTVPADSFAPGREVWIERDHDQQLRARIKVHNAAMVFRRGNSALDFYLHTAQRILALNTGSIAPQFIGPKLLTALHNVAQFPVWETAAMLPPVVAGDLLTGEGPALELFMARSMSPPAAFNLCSSLADEAPLNSLDIPGLIEKLRSSD